MRGRTLIEERFVKRKREFTCVVVLFLIGYAVFPWIAPAYNHNLVLSVRLATGSVPTYDVLLQNQALWPVTLTNAQWLVTHFGIYNVWTPSEAPIQNFTLLPSQPHSFQFTIYNATTTTTGAYFNGTLTIELRATIDVLGAVSQVRIVASYNATGSQ
jgi:hypothetical protein